MKTNRIRLAGAIAVTLILGTLSPGARGDASGNAVTEWNGIAVSTVTALPGPADGAPPASQIHVANPRLTDSLWGSTPMNTFIDLTAFASHPIGERRGGHCYYGQGRPVLSHTIATVPDEDAN